MTLEYDENDRCDTGDYEVAEAFIKKVSGLKDALNLDRIPKNLDQCAYLCSILERDETREYLHNELDKIRILIDYFAIK